MIVKLTFKWFLCICIKRFPTEGNLNWGSAKLCTNQLHCERHWSGWGSVVVVGSLGLIMTLKCSFSLRFKWSALSASHTCFLDRGNAPGRQKRGGKKSKWSYISIYLRQSCCGGGNVLNDSSRQRQSTHRFLFFFQSTNLNDKQRTEITKMKLFFPLIH